MKITLEKIIHWSAVATAVVVCGSIDYKAVIPIEVLIARSYETIKAISSYIK